MENNTLEVGAVVRLKSGGPKMTVSQYPYNKGNGQPTKVPTIKRVECDWFEGSELKTASFDERELDIVND